MADQASTASAKVKESSVLTDGSLSVLAREIGADKVSGIVLCMYLNLPTTTIINVTNGASDIGLRDADDATKIETTQKLLLIWKSLRVGSKEKDKVRDLEKALREMGKSEWADAVNDRHANQVELTPDAFPA